jgi:hypothetical protein
VKNFSNPPLWVLHKPGTKNVAKTHLVIHLSVNLNGRLSNPPLQVLHKPGTKKCSKNAFSNPPLCELKREEFSKSPHLMHRKKSNPLYDIFAIVGYGETVIQDQQ